MYHNDRLVHMVAGRMPTGAELTAEFPGDTLAAPHRISAILARAV